MKTRQSLSRRILVSCIGFIAYCGPLGIGFGVAQPATASDQKLVLTGSSTIAPLALEIAKRFEKQNPGVRVDVQSGGSTRGVMDALSGLADIGLASRPLKPEERGLTAHRIAMDGIAIILNAKNSVEELSDQQIKQIFRGQTKNWRVLGGADRKISVVNKAEGHSTLDLFLHHFKLRNPQIRAHVVIGSNQQGIKTVAGNVGAIGYVSIGTAEYEEARGTPIRRLAMDGIQATSENVRTGRFPLSRPLNLVTQGEPTGLAKRFIEFARSAEVDDLIKAQYFVPLTH